MAAESSTGAAGGRSGSGGASADSYIGSLISLTSKSEIRYEGILYNINTDESSIGLRNVRSFGTEGRKKDGPQVPPSDKIYEYILFRGSDIKDLQVKASPPVQTAPPINSDPAIIQSHYPHPTVQPTSLLAGPSAPRLDHGSTSAQMGLPGSAFQSGLPLYQPGGNMNSWRPTPPPNANANANASGMAMPMYWQGFYGPPGSLPQLPQQSLLRPPPGLSIPATMQQMQFPAFSSSLPMAVAGLPSSIIPDHHISVVPKIVSSSSLTSTSLPAPALSINVPSLQTGPLPTETISKLPNNVPSSSVATSTSSSSLPSFSQVPISVPDNAGIPSFAVKTVPIPGPVTLTQQSVSQPRKAANAGPFGSVLLDAPTPSLVTPGHPSIAVKTVAIPCPANSTQHSVSQPRKAASAPTGSVPVETPLVMPGQLLQPPTSATSQVLQTTQKDVEVVQVSPNRLSVPSVTLERGGQPPILPLPPNTRTHKANGGAQNMQNYYRGRGGRGYGTSRPVTKFIEDFDFTAMNEKFKKDEVWGHLGKGTKSQFKEEGEEEDGSGNDDEDTQDQNDAEIPKIEVKPVYNKDDFFDTLSCNALDSDPNHGRTRYSEQIKLDTETFGEFTRYRGGRGGRGGGLSHRSYYGRGGYGGYGYMNRVRGRGVQTRTS